MENFKELEKYKETKSFFFELTDTLSRVCNAPRDKSGVYLVYAIEGKQEKLIYIGRSGNKEADGSMFVRKAGSGGIHDRIVGGNQFGGARRKSWKKQMEIENIKKMKIYWYVTHNENFVDCPIDVEKAVLTKYYSTHGQLPRWNKTI